MPIDPKKPRPERISMPFEMMTDIFLYLARRPWNEVEEFMRGRQLIEPLPAKPPRLVGAAPNGTTSEEESPEMVAMREVRELHEAQAALGSTLEIVATIFQDATAQGRAPNEEELKSIATANATASELRQKIGRLSNAMKNEADMSERIAQSNRDKLKT